MNTTTRSRRNLRGVSTKVRMEMLEPRVLLSASIASSSIVIPDPVNPIIGIEVPSHVQFIEQPTVDANGDFTVSVALTDAGGLNVSLGVGSLVGLAIKSGPAGGMIFDASGDNPIFTNNYSFAPSSRIAWATVQADGLATFKGLGVNISGTYTLQAFTVDSYPFGNPDDSFDPSTITLLGFSDSFAAPGTPPIEIFYPPFPNFSNAIRVQLPNPSPSNSAVPLSQKSVFAAAPLAANSIAIEPPVISQVSSGNAGNILDVIGNPSNLLKDQ